MRLPIHLQREIARLHFHDSSQSNRAIARSCGAAPNTVRSMRRAIRSSPLSWAELHTLDDVAWCSALQTDNRSIAKRKGAPDWNWVREEMQRPDATLEQLWREWRGQCPEGIAYSQFTAGYRTWARQQHVVMRRVHVPGDKLFVDYAGRTVEIRDIQGGPSWYAQIFVAVLGYSNLTYIEATKTQTTEDWVHAHANCFRAMGGVPKWVVSDNLKAAVWRRERDRIVINPTYRECLTHYDSAPLPAGPRKPRHKPKAEVGVQIAQRWTLFALRNQVFFSLDELNAELLARTEQLNQHAFKKIRGCRRDRFEHGERAALKPLPDVPYQTADWKYDVKIPPDYHLEHQGNFYSVPQSLSHERADLRFNASIIEIFHKGKRVALHAAHAGHGETSTIPEHRPLVHQRVLEGEPKALIEWAAGAGQATSKMIRHHVESRTDATNGVRAARRMREFARIHGEPRFEEVCAYALARNITALRSIESILKSSADKQVPRTPASGRPVGEVRGAAYYGEGQ